METQEQPPEEKNGSEFRDPSSLREEHPVTDRTDDLVCRESGPGPKDGEDDETALLAWEYSMYVVSVFLAVFGLMVWHFSLPTLLSNQRIPDILQEPCYFSFFLLAVIFFAIGLSVREMEGEGGGKLQNGPGTLRQRTPSSTQVERLPIHDDIKLDDLSFKNSREEGVFRHLFEEQEDGVEKGEQEQETACDDDSD